MAIMVQIRNMPDDMHRILKSRAVLAGMSLSDYLLAELRRSAEAPTLAEMRARLAADGPTELDLSVADLVREERDRR